MSEVEEASNEVLLKSFAVLTHRLHSADRNREQQVLAADLRAQRNILQAEILRRME